MTFPAGHLPDPSDVNGLSLVQNFNKSLAYAGSATVDLTDSTNGLFPCATAFYCTTSGNLVATLAGDVPSPAAANNRTFPVTAGQVLRGLFVLIDSSSTAVGILLQ